MAKILYAQNGKRDLHGLEAECDRAIARLAGEEWRHPANRECVAAYLRACKHGKAKSGGRPRKIKRSTLYRVLGVLRLASEQWLDQPFDAATQATWDEFHARMEDDQIRNAHGRPYRQSTKAKNYKTLKKFLAWRGEAAYCADWDTVEEVPTKEALTRAEVERMVEATATLRVKTLLLILFDGGFRIEELANLRWTDVQRPDGREYYRAHVRRETSKTGRERWVSLWLATDLIDAYRHSEEQRQGCSFSESCFLFATSYNKLYTTVRRIGERVLGKRISPHTLRHSSASYYANVIKTYQQFCSRYGWRLQSGVAQRYYHEMDDHEVATQAKEHEIARFKGTLGQLQVENQQLRRSLDEQETTRLATTGIVEQRLTQTEQEKQLLEEQLTALQAQMTEVLGVVQRLVEKTGGNALAEERRFAPRELGAARAPPRLTASSSPSLPHGQ